MTKATPIDKCDRELLRLFGAFKAAHCDAVTARPLGHPLTAAAWRRRDELRRSIMATPAHGAAGIAVKLALSPHLKPIASHDSIALYENEQAEPIRAAFEDAIAVAGLNRDEFLALPA